MSSVESPIRPLVRRGTRDQTPLLLWGIVLAGAVLRVIAIAHKSFWLDEIASVAIARKPWPAFWRFLWHDEGNMALYYLLLKPWLHVGYGEGAVRLLSVIPGVLSLPCMYLLGSRLFSRRAGILATLFLALNACAIAVSQEARAYSFLLTGVVLSTYLFVLLVESPRSSSALAYALATGFGCYFHYFGVLVPAAHYVSVFMLPRERRPWKLLYVAALIIVAMMSPVLWLMHAQDAGHISWLEPPSWLEVYHLGVFLASDGGKAVGGILLGLDLVLVGFFFTGFSRAWGKNTDTLQHWRYSLVASGFATPIVITLLVSMARPAFYHRFLIICLPAWLLMTALGVEQILARGWRRIAVGGVCALSLTSTVLMYGRVTEDWRDAITYLLQYATPQDRVLYFQSVGEFAGESYRDWLPGGDSGRPFAIGVGSVNSDWKQELDHPRRVWLVLYREKPLDAQAHEIEEVLERSYVVSSEKDFPGITILGYKPK